MKCALQLCGFVLLLALACCGGRPIPFPSPESELGDRPGLFTGEDGAWRLYPQQSPPHPLSDRPNGAAR